MTEWSPLFRRERWIAARGTGRPSSSRTTPEITRAPGISRSNPAELPRQIRKNSFLVGYPSTQA